MERWLEVVGVEETTRDRYEDLIRVYILPTFGDMQLARIDPELLNASTPGCTAAGICARTAHRRGTSTSR